MPATQSDPCLLSVGGRHFGKSPVMAAGLAVVAAMLVFAGCDQPNDSPPTGNAVDLGHDISSADPIAWTESALIGSAPKRTRTIAALMLDLGMGPPDPAKVKSAMESVRRMYLEESYGIQDLAIDAVGPWKLPVAKCLSNACCGPSSDRTGNGATVTSAISSLGKTYDHYFYVYGAEPSGAGCGTWGDAGNPTSPAKYSSIEPMWLTSTFPIEQELGHNLGMQHEHTLSCSGGAAFADNPSSCTNNEYGSHLSYMGSGSGECSAYHKVHQGWLSGCNGVKGAGTGTFTLLPLELPCDGTQVLQVPMGKQRTGPGGALTSFYVELRTPVGRDMGNPTKPTVAVYAGPDFSAPKSYASHTYLVAQLTAAGQLFADPAGNPTITVTAIGMASATITVAGGSGSPTCLDGSAFTPPGRDASSCAAPVSTPNGGAAGGVGGSGAGGSSGMGTGGRGSAGASGSGGLAATGGSGSAGRGGAVGTGARGMSTGGTSSGGATSTGGTTSSGGSSSSGGTTSSGGSSSASGGISGTGGSNGSATGGATGTGAPHESGQSGCACEVAGTAPAAPGATFLLLFGLAWAAAARRRAKPVVASGPDRASRAGEAGRGGPSCQQRSRQ